VIVAEFVAARGVLAACCPQTGRPINAARAATAGMLQERKLRREFFIGRAL
jgi:hypothetical protein